MKKEAGYKIILAIFLAVIVIQWVFIASKSLKPKKPPEVGVVPAAVKGKIAIVIDDWGYNVNNLSILDQIQYPLTAAILPNLNYSRQVAEELHSRGLEVILHLPMEPVEKFRLEKNTVMVSFDEAAVKDVPGFVSVVNTTADPLSKKFRVEVTADNPGLVLRPGTFGSVEFEVTSHENALAVAQKAVFDNKYVYVVEGGKALKREIMLGLKNTTMIEVLDGLKEGDQVIVEGAFGLIDGTAVEIRK